jgi:hypothetical protein
MNRAGVPVTLQPDGSGRLTQITYDDMKWWVSASQSDEVSVALAHDNLSPEQESLLKQTQDRDDLNLVIDGTDHSSEYLACAGPSTYEALMNPEQLGGVDPDIERRQVEANLQWASCARDHGFPDVQDPPSVRDAAVKIPITMEPAQLRALLVDCPNFNPDSQARLDEWVASQPPEGSTDGPPQVPLDPIIQLDPLDITGLSQAEIDRGMELWEVLAERQVRYAAEHQSDQPS